MGKALGARYIIGGTLRQADAQLRVAVQLVDAVSAVHLWAESFDRPFRSDDIFAIQDELVPRIVFQPDLVDTFLDGLRKAGLDIDGQQG